MRQLLIPLSVVAAQAAAAEPLRIAADIAPVQSLVAMVSLGVTVPGLVIDPLASPHDYALRPSEAAALAHADVVFWVGPGLTAWLDETLDVLAGGAVVVNLSAQDGLTHWVFREEALFAADNEDHDDHDGQDDGAGDTAGHGHDGDDPHMWLDPVNALRWLDVIAETLSAQDPENAALYAANAAVAQASIATLDAQIEAMFATVPNDPFIVYHDAFQYFEKHFDREAMGAIASSEATDPGPARVALIRDAVVEHGAVCVFTEPQSGAARVAALVEGTGVRTAVLDPLGSTIPTGPDHYLALLDAIAGTMVDCLGGE